MPSSRNSRPRWKLFLYAFGVVGFAAWLHVSGLRTAIELKDGWHERRSAEAEIEALKERNSQLESEIQQLEDDGIAVERLAREKLGMAREGEVVIRIPQKQ